MWPEIKRKFFHLLGLSYVLALIYVQRNTYIIILGSLLALEFFVETGRVFVIMIRWRPPFLPHYANK